MKKYILSHDFGTSSDKIILFSTDGSIIRSHSETYHTYIGPDRDSEQDPEDWWKAFCQGNVVILEGIDPGELACVAIDGTDPNLICIGKDHKAIGRSIMWNDTRAKDAAETWNQKHETQINAGSAAARLLWMHEHHPEILSESAMILSTNHSYLIYRLCGKAVCDTDSAIDSGMYIRSERRWNTEMLKEAKVSLDCFPEIVDPTQIVGEVSENISEKCHLAKGIPLIGGLPDASAAAVGTGALLLHNAVLSCGTSAGIMYKTEHEDFGFKPFSFSISAGSSYNWALKTLLGERDFALAEQMILNSSAGSNGVIFHPYLSGERKPYSNPSAKGSWTGLSQATTRNDLLRSVVEGIVINLALILEEIREKGYIIDEMTITGGFSRSDAICQIIADVMNVRLHTLRYPDLSGAIGSAVLGGVAVGIWEDLSVIRQFIQFERTFVPDQTASKFYSSRIALFREIYGQLESVYPGL